MPAPDAPDRAERPTMLAVNAKPVAGASARDHDDIVASRIIFPLLFPDGPHAQRKALHRRCDLGMTVHDKANGARKVP